MKLVLLKLLNAVGGLNAWYDQLPEPTRFLVFFVPTFAGLLGLSLGHGSVMAAGIVVFALMCAWGLTRVMCIHGQYPKSSP
jgi:hypothetical protein